MPIRNESNFISNTLDSIINQDCPDSNFEIIIADGMSNDGTREILQKYLDEYSNIILVDNPEKIVPTGFNRALNVARGDIIVRVDGHSIIANDYLKNCVELLIKKGASNVGGLMRAEGVGFFDKVVSTATSSKFGIGNAQFHYSDKGQWVDTVYMGSWKRSVFENNGGFDEELTRNQDDEFNFRLIQNGGKIWLDSSIESAYYPRNSLKKLFKQYFEYGLYKVRVIQKRRSVASFRHLVPGLFVLTLLTSLGIAPLSFFPFLSIIAVYILTNIIVTLVEIQNSFKLFFWMFIPLPIVFFILHFSYGLGFLTALIKFWNKWFDIELKDSLFNQEQFIKNSSG